MQIFFNRIFYLNRKTNRIFFNEKTNRIFYLNRFVKNRLDRQPNLTRSTALELTVLYLNYLNQCFNKKNVNNLVFIIFCFSFNFYVHKGLQFI